MKRESRKGKTSRGWLLGAAMILCAMVFLGAPAAAAVQQAPATTPDGFVPASSLPARQEMPAAPLVVAAYSVAWLAIYFYLWTIWRRIARVEREMLDVSRRIEAGARR